MTTKVHRVRYYNPKPQPINCISFNKTSKHLAIARGDASIEIWDLNYAPYAVKFIPGIENGSVEALCWVQSRLLSTGLGGALIEWDLEELIIKTTALLTGYAAWCLDVSSDNTLAAVGTEQGYVNLFSVENDEIVYRKLFDKQEGRILCCKFNKAGNMLATGSVDTIRVWNVETGHATCRMNVSRHGKEVIVWCLGMLSDNTVVSGDSWGRLTFWDATLGDQIDSYKTHKSDILSIAVSDDEKDIYLAGVDPIIMHFVKVEQNISKDRQMEMQWVKTMQRNIHEHEVRGLVLNERQLISVGTDGYITLSSHPPKWVMRIPPMIPAPRSSVCTSKKLLLLRYSNYLEIWKLGEYTKDKSGNIVVSKMNNTLKKPKESNLEQDTANALIKNDLQKCKNQDLKLSENPVNLAMIKTKGNKQMRCCEISPNGDIIVYSTDSAIRMLKLETDDDQNVSLSKLLISGMGKTCDRVAFTEDSSTMVAHTAGVINVLHVDPESGATVIQSISTQKYFQAKSLLHLTISQKTSSGISYLVAADTKGSIVVWIQNGKKFEHYVTLPTYHCVPSALSVNSEKQYLIAVYVNQKIVEYDLANKKFRDWVESALPAAWSSRRAAVLAARPHPARDALLLHDATSLWIMDKMSDEEEESVTKKPKTVKQSKKIYASLKIIPIKYLAGFHCLGNDEAVAIEVSPENIVSQLPVTNKT